MGLSLLSLEKSLTNLDEQSTREPEIVWSFTESEIQDAKELYQKGKEIGFSFMCFEKTCKYQSSF